jgi:hypothetical protein
VINAVLPFATVIVVTCVGMYADGLAKLQASDPDMPRTLVNIVSKVWAAQRSRARNPRACSIADSPVACNRIEVAGLLHEHAAKCAG